MFIFYPERSYLRPQPKCDKREENKINLGVRQGAKHRLRGFIPRNMVAPYEMRSSEVRGNGFVIKQMRLEDAKSAPIPSSRRLYTTSNRIRALRRRYARLVPGYHILHHKGAATRSCERPLRHHIVDTLGLCEAPIEGLYTPQ